jgi:lysophospholipase L1-like esterase
MTTELTRRAKCGSPAWAVRLLTLLVLLCGTLPGSALAEGINPGIYLAAGDSITQGYDSDTWWSRGYLPYLADLLNISESQIVNVGISGATAEQGLASFREDLLAVLPQYVLILFGTNDISQSVPTSETIAALSAMIDAARTIGSIPVLGTVIPRGNHAQDSFNRHALALNSMILELAGATEGTGWADHFGMFLANPCAPLDCGPDDREFWVDGVPYDLCCYYSDALHPNQLGYQLISQSWHDGLLARGEQPPLPGDYSAPWVAYSSPGDGDSGVPPESAIFIRLNDLGSGVNSGSITLAVAGVTVAPGGFQVTGMPDSLEITYTPEIPFTTGSTIEVVISAEDLAVPPNVLESYAWSFHVSAGDGQSYGDIDSSGRIDGIDLSLLAHAFGSASWEDRYLEAADLNGDGVVDGEDLARLAAYFGETF